MKILPIGISNFKELREGDFYYVDKTLLIDELKNADGKIILIPRPRRFGKTLNLSMLRYFFGITNTSNAHLFEGTALWQLPEYQKIQGTFPVIFLTFKNCKEDSWEDAYRKFVELIVLEFERYSKILTPELSPDELYKYKDITSGKAHSTLYTHSLFFLSMLLERYYKKRVIILIDEYDAPIHAAYTNGYYKEMIKFMTSLLTQVLKDNDYLERSILTGILRTAKEGIFSGLNNLTVRTLLDDEFSDKFGFTPDEVEQLLIDAKLSDKNNLVKEWYNGYHCGKSIIYNPWSLLECVSKNGATKPYWANTSGNELIKKLIAQADDVVKTELESLLSGESIKKEIDSELTLLEIENNENALWSLLLFAGYITFTDIEETENNLLCTLTIPNKEIKLLYRKLITTIVQQSLSLSQIRQLKESLVHADGKLFGEMLQEFTLKSTSVFDLPNNEPERSYHLFVLGLLVTFSDSFEVKSNRESGTGRYDILLIPYAQNGWGIIIEFKKVASDAQETMEHMAQEALDQIIKKQYAQELKDRGIKNITAFGVACRGKKTLVKSLILATEE